MTTVEKGNQILIASRHVHFLGFYVLQFTVNKEIFIIFNVTIH